MIIEVVGCWNWVKGIIHLGTGNVKLQNETKIKSITKSCGLFLVLQTYYKVTWTVVELLCNFYAATF